MVNVKAPLELALVDEVSGGTRGVAEAMYKLTQAMVERTRGGNTWYSDFHLWVEDELSRVRAEARAETLMEHSEDGFTLGAVTTALQGAGRRQASMRLPRMAPGHGVAMGS